MLNKCKVWTDKVLPSLQNEKVLDLNAEAIEVFA